MSYKDLHEKPFSESTIAKLEIFDAYIKAWLPTFVHSDFTTISMVDFFSGNGYQNGIAGSSIRMLQNVKLHVGNIFNNKKKIKIFLNEFEPNKKNQLKFEQLKISCNEYLENNKDVQRAIELIYYNEDFVTLFPKLILEIKKYPSLVFLDQNGIKFLSDIYLLELEKTKHTDFLYFVSSSYFTRFGHLEEFKKHLSLDIDEIKNNPYQYIHKQVVTQLKNKLPTSSNLKLYPFSLKKGANIHGIIFGAKHPLAVDKFLEVAWKMNPINGDANFDIDDDAAKSQYDIFGEIKYTKIEAFKNLLREKILTGIIINNFQALSLAHEEGHIGKHAAECIKAMKQNNEIDYNSRSPLVSYENVHKLKKEMKYKILKNEN